MWDVSGEQGGVRESRYPNIYFENILQLTVNSIEYRISANYYSLLPERSFSNSASALSISGSSILIIVFMSTVLKMYSINIYIIWLWLRSGQVNTCKKVDLNTYILQTKSLFENQIYWYSWYSLTCPGRRWDICYWSRRRQDREESASRGRRQTDSVLCTCIWE